MPAVLIEPAFITNPVDELRIDDADFRGAIAHAISSAVQRYYEIER
jgi:N-acetylmuramoyl-L-alanine amidase